MKVTKQTLQEERNRISLHYHLNFARRKLLCRSPYRDFYQGFLFGCLSSLFLDFCFCFSVFCFRSFSLSFLPPLSPITSLLFLLSKTFSRSVVSYCNHSRPIIINCNLAYFSKSVNYRFQEGGIGFVKPVGFCSEVGSKIGCACVIDRLAKN